MIDPEKAAKIGFCISLAVVFAWLLTLAGGF